MKNTKNVVPNKGFTLIELLVVVLIIGILAAVALPQYKLAVIKSRISTFLPLAKSMVSAENAYYLASGTYTVDATQLDLSMPAECTLADNGIIRHWKCGNDFLVDFSDNLNGLYLNYCPNYNTSFETCKGKRDFRIIFNYPHLQPYCTVDNQSNLGKKICKTLALK